MSSNEAAANEQQICTLSPSFPYHCRKSSFGVQPRSHMRSAPSFGFGTSLRESTEKQYISRPHARTMSGNNSPGAVYKCASSIGAQIASEKSSSPAFGFGDSSRSTRDHTANAPGPGTYKRPHSVGKQIDSRRTTSTCAVFGSSTRNDIQKMYMDEEMAKTYYGLETPPPNSYKIPSGMGHQVMSARRSSPGWGTQTARRFRKSDHRLELFDGSKNCQLPSACGQQIQSSRQSSPKFSFGLTTREKLEKVLISAEHAKQSPGGCSPGPGICQSPSGLGRQQLSYKKSAPGWGFGSSPRGHRSEDDLPGPGAYCV